MRKFEIIFKITADTTESNINWLNRILNKTWVEEILYQIGIENEIEFKVEEAPST